MRLFFFSTNTCGPGAAEQDKECQMHWGGGEDSLVHEVDPDMPRVRCVNPRLVTGSVPIRDELSALVDSGSVQR